MARGPFEGKSPAVGIDRAFRKGATDETGGRPDGAPPKAATKTGC